MTASCLCGAVRLRLDPPLRDVVVCHCSLCRRWGTHAGAYTAAPRGAIHVEKGDLTWYEDPNGRWRGFCAACGSSLLWDRGGETISVSAGALDGPTGLTVAARIYVADAADWEVVPHDAPHHDAGRT